MNLISLTVNGTQFHRDVEPRTQLADFLREQLLLTGTHVGCEHGICGACTVVIDGEIARSCITYAVACDGASVRTIEGFEDDLLMARLRAAFSQEHALQCGYCTPGMLIAARDLIRRNTARSEAEIRVAMSGNLCRCTGYSGIVKAIALVIADRDAVAGGIEPPAKHLGPWIAMLPAEAGRSHRFLVTASLASSPDAPKAVALGEIVLDDMATRLTQTIRVAHAPDTVWRLMADVERVAACLPGVTLDGPERDGKVEGRMTVRLGPIAPTFAGSALVRRFPAERRLTIEGRGGDLNSRSRASGRIECALVEDGPEATRVEVAIAYTLTGPLAQFGRAGLIKDLVGRIAAEFARNLEARLSGRENAGAASAAELDAGALFLGMMWRRFRGVISRLFGAKR